MAKKTLVLTAVLSVLFLLNTSKANAEWYTCTVESIGTAGSAVMVQLGNTAFNGGKQWFKADPANPTAQNRVMAAALTAMSLGKTVDIAVALPFPDVPDYPTIRNFYVK